MEFAYNLDDFYRIMQLSPPYQFDKAFYSLFQSIDAKVVPMFAEKSERKVEHRKRSHNNNNNHSREDAKELKESWENMKAIQAPPVKEKTGVEKCIQEIRVCINKMTSKNYENQKDKILELLATCLEENDSNQEENLQKVSGFIFSVASTNKLFANNYASLYKELMNKYDVFGNLVQDFLNNYVNSVKNIKYVEPDVNYEEYCMYNKQNELRRSTAVFLVHLVKNDVLAVTRILNVIAAFQDLTNVYIEEDDRLNEVDEIAEILFLFLKEGKDIFSQCKGEWIWKFVIIPNVEKISKIPRGEKVSLSSRAIFKYKDMFGGT
jgi:hypothetical protein